MKWIGNIDWFVPALLLAIGLAWLWPEGGIGTGDFSVRVLSGIGVSVIFFLYGLRLNHRVFVGNLKNWRLHILIQATTFLIFPLIALSARYLFGDAGSLWQGIIFLSVMPSTVSSAVVLVSLANGDVPAAIFNSSVSSIAGILISPLLLGLFLVMPQFEIQPVDVFLKLLIQILLPLVLGISLNPFFGKTALRYKGFTRYFDQLVILSIVYYSFANSFYIDQFSGLTVWNILMLVFLLFMLFVGVNASIYFVSRRLKLPSSDTTTALFCGSTKSLVHGSAMGIIIFAGNSAVGLILLPLLLYHSMQLLLSGIMVSRINRINSRQNHT